MRWLLLTVLLTGSCVAQRPPRVPEPAEHRCPDDPKNECIQYWKKFKWSSLA